MEIDRETAQAMNLNIELRRMTESDGWKVAKGMLLERIAILDSVSSLPEGISFEEAGKQAMYRAHAISLMKGWLDDVESRVEQSNQQEEVLLELHENTVVRQYG
jgi:hypothetical protein